MTTVVDYVDKKGNPKTKTEYSIVIENALGEGVVSAEGKTYLELLTLFNHLGKTAYADMATFIRTFFNGDRHGRLTIDGWEQIMYNIFHHEGAPNQELIDFCFQWEQFYTIGEQIMGDHTTQRIFNNYEVTSPSTIEFIGISPHSDTKKIIDLINELNRQIRDAPVGTDLLDREANYLNTPNEGNFVTFTEEQFRKMDEIIYFFSQMFGFVSPTRANFPSIDISLVMSSEGTLTGMRPSVSLPSLEGFNNLLNNINDRFYYEGDSFPRPQFSGLWVPFVYRIQSLNLNPFGTVKGEHKYSFAWPTTADPNHRIQKGTMSTYELLTLKALEIFHQLGISDVLTELHTSREMPRLMTYKKFPGSGQLDFTFTLRWKFTNALELMGAGETMYIPSNRRWDLTYGVDTDGKIKIQRIDFHIATIAVAYNDAVLDWYD